MWTQLREKRLSRYSEVRKSAYQCSCRSGKRHWIQREEQGTAGAIEVFAAQKSTTQFIPSCGFYYELRHRLFLAHPSTEIFFTLVVGSVTHLFTSAPKTSSNRRKKSAVERRARMRSPKVTLNDFFFMTRQFKMTYRNPISAWGKKTNVIGEHGTCD